MAFPFSNTIKTCVLRLTVSGFAALAPTIALAEKSTEPASPSVFKITVDRAKVVRISRDADTVIVGNPLIVDATIQDSKTIVLTGRSYGVTNFIVLDSIGETIVDETIVVQTHEQNVVRIYRQSSRETLACSPICERTLTIGDNPETFDNAATQIEKRNAISKPQN